MESFEFRVYSRRYNNRVTYKLVHTKNGWHISNIAINGDSMPDGAPFLYENFNQDFISYPSNVGDFFEYVWSNLENKKITPLEAQLKINEVAEWVSRCEEFQPNWKGWNI